MRKWVFIVLPVVWAVAFVVVYYVMSSAEYSYLSTNSKDTYEVVDQEIEQQTNLFSANTALENQTTIPSTITQNKKTSSTKSTFPLDRSDFEKEGVFAVSQNSTSDMRSENLSNSTVLNLPSVNMDKDSSKAVFITGVSPVISFSLNFVNEQILPFNFALNNAPVGGLSALSYDQDKNIFIALSDDKGHKGPPRFYELKLDIRETEKPYTLQMIKQISLRNRQGQIISQIDPEGIDFFRSDHIFISTEGAQMRDLFAPPALFMFDTNGILLSSWDLPKIYWPDNHEQVGEWGVKENKGFEALSISPDKNWLYLATESSLHQDDQGDSSNQQYIRISRFDIETAKMADQFIYPMDVNINIGNFSGTNGLTDFLSLEDEQMITVERAYLKDSTVSSDRKSDMTLVRLFLTNCFSASNVSQYEELKEGQFITCGKSLLADLSSVLGNGVDNIEGIAMGPEVSPGNYLLVLVSDNNFRQTQKTQFLFFHYSPEEKTVANISRIMK